MVLRLARTRFDDDPARAISLLNVLAVQARQLGPTQASAEENRKHGAVADSLERRQIRKCQELFCPEPMAQAHSAPFCALCPSDACRKCRRHHAVVQEAGLPAYRPTPHHRRTMAGVQYG